MLGAAATQACFIQDEMVFTLSTTDTTALPTGGFNANSTRRSYRGQYSWLATLVPVYGDVQASYSRNSMIMSLVVFNQRRFQSAPVSRVCETDTERAATVSSFGGATSVAYGGGDLTSRAPRHNIVEREFESRRMADARLDGQRRAAVERRLRRPAALFPLVSNRGGVATADCLADRGTRPVTVNGADINLNSMVAGSAMAFIYDGAVGVYERPVHLEGPSLWSN